MNKKKAYVIGTNVSTSLSPTIFKYWFNKYNVDGEYGYIEIKEKNFEKEIKTILKDNKLIGLNITMPYKEKIIPHLKNKEKDRTTLDHTAKDIGVVNYIIKNFSGTTKYSWVGCNSDGFGFSKAIEPFEKQMNKKTATAIVIGCGGAAKAIIYYLLGYKKIKIFNRSFEKIKNIYDLNFFKTNDFYKNRIEIYKLKDLKEHTHDADLIINTTPTNPLDSFTEWTIGNNTFGFDAVYRPRLGTGFLNHFTTHKRIEGIYMLAWQALACWNNWFAGPDTEISPEGNEVFKNRAEIDDGLMNCLFKKMDENK